MQVRTLHFSDFLKLGRMHQADIGLNLPFALVMPDLPLPAAFTQHLPVNSLNSSVYICEEQGKPQAFMQARARQRRDEWEVLSLGVIGNVQPEAIEIAPLSPADSEQPSPEPAPPTLTTAEAEGQAADPLPEDEPAQDGEANSNVVQAWPDEIEFAWLKLLEHLVVDAGEKGIVRVYARLSTESPQYDLFNQTGFHPYTHESLFFLPYTQQVERPASEQFQLKEQRNRDAWFIQQLYSAITPSFVQNSEQTTSRTWEIHRAYLPRPTRETGWLLMEDSKAAASVRILSYRNKHMIRLMNLDTRRELLPDLIRFALSTIKAGPDTQVYCIVREYQMEQETMLEDAGFTRIFGKQAVLVKHTVQYVRSPERQLVRGREGKFLRPDVLVRFARFVRQHLYSVVI